MSHKPNLEWNKIAACVLLSGLIIMVLGLIADALYVPVKRPEVRGYQIAVENGSDVEQTAEKEEEPVDIAVLLANADIESGKKVAKKCTSCHAFDKDGKHKTGPTLWNVVGKNIARHGDYKYSKALQSISGQKWDYQALYGFITKPKAFAKGTKMGFAGIRKPQQTADLIAYLRGLSDNPKPLP